MAIRRFTSIAMFLMILFSMQSIMAQERGGLAEGTLGADRPRLDATISADPAVGAKVLYLRPGGRADRAGIKLQDKIIKFGDMEIATASDLLPAMLAVTPGSTVDIVVLRDGKQVVVTVTF